MARGKRFVRGGRSVRESMWIGITETNSTLTAANQAVIINNGNAALAVLRPFTVVRIRGVLAYRSDQVIASESFHAACGYEVVSDQASAIGATAIPTPYFDLGSDFFFVHQFMSGRFEFITGAGFDPRSFTTIEYDSKAMRKVDDDSDVVVVLETGSISSGVNIYHAGWMLIKLH